MTSLVRILSHREAERLTDQIKFTIESIDNGLFKLRNLLEEARSTNVWQMLDFSSWTAYISSLFEGRPMRLPRDERLQLVSYLSGEGMSTRAIAPIVGVDRKTVERDISGGTNVPPAGPEEPQAPVGEEVAAPVDIPRAPSAATVDPLTNKVIPAEMIDATDDEFEASLAASRAEGDMSQDNVVSHLRPVDPKPVIGLDGKEYKRPVPKVIPRGDDAAQLNAETESKALGRALMTLTGMRFPEHRTRVITEWWPAGNDAVPPDSRALFEPRAIRDIATWLMQMADELEGTS